MTKRRTRPTMGEQLARLEQLMQPLFEGKSAEDALDTARRHAVEQIGKRRQPADEQDESGSTD